MITSNFLYFYKIFQRKHQHVNLRMPINPRWGGWIWACVCMPLRIITVFYTPFFLQRKCFVHSESTVKLSKWKFKSRPKKFTGANGECEWVRKKSGFFSAVKQYGQDQTYPQHAKSIISPSTDFWHEKTFFEALSSMVRNSTSAYPSRNNLVLAKFDNSFLTGFV